MTGTGGYRRLPGKGRTLVSWHTLWLVEDHLLAVHATGYTETYRRFYFKDIQAMVTRRTRRGRNWNLLLGLLATLAGAAALASSSGMAREAWLAVAVLVLLAMAVNLLLGPTCICSLQMPFSNHELPSVRRLRTARRIMERIRPAIGKIQGELTAAEIATRSVSPAKIEESGVPRQPTATLLSPSIDTSYLGLPHRVLFILLLADAVFTPFELIYHTKMLQGLNMLLTLAQLGFIIAALVKQRDHYVPKAAKRLSWGALANMLLGYAAVSAYTFFYIFTTAVANRESAYRGGAPPELETLDHPFLVGMAVEYAIVSVIIGAAGLVAMLRGASPSGVSAVKSRAAASRNGAP